MQPDRQASARMIASLRAMLPLPPAASLARAFEPHHLLIAVDIGDAIARFHPGAGVGMVILIVIGPERAMDLRAARQVGADDRFDIFEGQHFRASPAPLQVGSQRLVFVGSHLVPLPQRFASATMLTDLQIELICRLCTGGAEQARRALQSHS